MNKANKAVLKFLTFFVNKNNKTAVRKKKIKENPRAKRIIFSLLGKMRNNGESIHKKVGGSRKKKSLYGFNPINIL